MGLCRVAGRRHTFLTLTARLLGPVLSVAFFSSQAMSELSPPSSLLAALLFFQPVTLISSECPGPTCQHLVLYHQLLLLFIGVMRTVGGSRCA